MFGLSGAAFATTVSFFVSTGYVIFQFLKLHSASISQLLAPNISDFKTIAKHTMNKRY
jgi:Na+-driven multidrug efflux pump